MCLENSGCINCFIYIELFVKLFKTQALPVVSNVLTAQGNVSRDANHWN